MTKKDLIRKLTSRKFISALLGFITAVLIAFKMSENEIAQIVAIVGSFMTLISYIFVEGNIDDTYALMKPDSEEQKEEDNES